MSNNRKPKYIKLDVVINDFKKYPMTEEKYNEFVDDFIQLVENYGWNVAGSLDGPLKEEELLSLENNK